MTSFTKHILISSAFVLFAIIWHFFVLRMYPKVGLVKLNFKKDKIMASYGIISFVYIAAFIGASAVFGYSNISNACLYIFVMGVMWILGGIDDIFGNRDVGGFKGHFKKLIFERKLTTGALKALGGGGVGIVAGYVISDGDILKWVVSALIIPLAANTLNLVDLRPGRAIAVFIFGLVVTYICSDGMAANLILISITIITIAFAPYDCLGKGMLGDSGSNMLGAALGVTIALYSPVSFGILAILFFAGLQVYSEKHSISALIETNKILRKIDRKLGVR